MNKKLMAAAVLAALANVACAASVDYAVTGLSGTWAYGYTEWNGYDTLGNLDNASQVGNVNAMLHATYAYSAPNSATVNGIYNFPNSASIVFSTEANIRLMRQSMVSGASDYLTEPLVAGSVRRGVLPNRLVEAIGRESATDVHGKQPRHDLTAVRRSIPETNSRNAHNFHGLRTGDQRIDSAHAGGLVPDDRRRQSTDQHGRRAGANDGTAHVGRGCHHWTQVKVGYSRGGRHVSLLIS